MNIRLVDVMKIPLKASLHGEQIWKKENKNPTTSFTILLLNSSKIQNHIEKLVLG